MNIVVKNMGNLNLKLSFGLLAFVRGGISP